MYRRYNENIYLSSITYRINKNNHQINASFNTRFKYNFKENLMFIKLEKLEFTVQKPREHKINCKRILLINLNILKIRKKYSPFQQSVTFIFGYSFIRFTINLPIIPWVWYHHLDPWQHNKLWIKSLSWNAWNPSGSGVIS